MNTELATEQDNAFLSYGQSVNQRTIVGDLLKFSKGEWLAGQKDEEIDDGTKLVAVMDELMVGWVKWVDQRPTEHLMGRVVDRFKPARRSELDEPTLAGTQDDPWQLTNYLILTTPKGERVFTYAPSSKGGLSAIGELAEQYGKMMRQKPDQFPVIEIGSTSYKHEKYGRVHKPVLKVVGWTKKDGALTALSASAAASAEPADDDEIPF